MRVLRDPIDMQTVEKEGIKCLVLQRYAALVEELGANEVSALVTFILLESGDSAADLVPQLGFSALVNRFTGVRFDEESFTPTFEFVNEYEDCYELVFVLSDDGSGVEVFVPKDLEEKSELLAMCCQFTNSVSGEDK